MTLKLKNCGYSVGTHVLLQDISATIANGVVTGILGANGAGKTSLLHIATGAEKAQPGSVQLCQGDQDYLLDSLSLNKRASHIAVLPQSSELEFPFSVEEVVLMGRIPSASDDATNRMIVAEVLGLLSLTDFSNRIYTSLSGGEKQRVQICRIICQVYDDLPNAHLLFDEPIAPLDIAYQIAFFKLIRTLASQGAAIGLVLHDIDLACRFCDEIILMGAGKIIASGKAAEVITAESIRAAFDIEVSIGTGPNGSIQLVIAD